MKCEKCGAEMKCTSTDEYYDRGIGYSEWKCPACGRTTDNFLACMKGLAISFPLVVALLLVYKALTYLFSL
jgi:hypothetical protein